jgi:ribosome biogenesis GTPase
VIVTKADLAGIHDGVVAQVADQAGAAEVVATSAETRDGLDELAQRIHPGQTVALLGPSGAGKSPLVNALAGARLQGAGVVRAADGRDRHTTTARELVPLPSGAVQVPRLRA